MNVKRKYKYFIMIIGLILLAIALFYFFIFNKPQPTEPTFVVNDDKLTINLFEDVSIETSKFVDSEELGFNTLYLIKKGALANDSENNNKTEIIKTTSNLKLHSKDNTNHGSTAIDIGKDHKLLVFYEYTINHSKGLSEEERIRKYNSEMLLFKKDGSVESYGLSEKLFVDLYKDAEGKIILEEKLFLPNYQNIPSWDRPHILYKSYVTLEGVELFSEEEVYSFD